MSIEAAPTHTPQGEFDQAVLAQDPETHQNVLVSDQGIEAAEQVSGKHRAPETEAEASFAQVQANVAAEHGVESSGRHQAAERFSVRAANRVADLAQRFGNFMSGRRTTREYARDKKDAAGEKIERGRDVLRGLGSSIVASSQSAKTEVSTRYKSTVERKNNTVDSVRGFFKKAKETARVHKDILVASIKNSGENMAASVRRGAENSRERAAKVGKNAAKVGEAALFGVLGTGVIAGEAIAKGAKAAGRSTREAAKTGARKAVEPAKRMAQDVKENVNDLRAGNAEYSAQRATAKAERLRAKSAAKSAKAADLRSRA